MKRKHIIILSMILVLALVFVGCASKSEDSYDMAASEPQSKEARGESIVMEEGGFGAMNAVEYDEMASIDGADVDKDLADPEELSEKIIYNVHASLLCEDVQEAVIAITNKVESLGGYISYANTYKSGGYSYANIEIRIPSQHLDIMEEYSYEIGDVEEYTMSTNNITENYYDIVTRLEINIVHEQQYLELMKQAKTIEETLLIRVELDKIQEKIESYKGRIKVWDSLVNYSTITYNLNPIPTLDNDIDDKPRIISLGETWRAMQRGFTNSYIAVLNFFSFILRMLAVLAIPLVIFGVVAIIVVILVKHGKGKGKEK